MDIDNKNYEEVFEIFLTKTKMLAVDVPCLLCLYRDFRHLVCEGLKM